MKMNIFSFRSFRSQLGFTMIELLIVITILGILAVAVLSALNPIEQINRGRDTGSKSDAEQLLGAIDRFYAFKGYYPWQTSADDSANASLEFQRVVDVQVRQDDSTELECDMLEVVSGGDETFTPVGDFSCAGSDELKLSFVDRISKTTYNQLWIFNNGTQGDSTYICFVPKSAAFQTDAITRCNGDNAADFPPEACGATTGATSPTETVLNLFPQAYAQGLPTAVPARAENYVCLP